MKALNAAVRVMTEYEQLDEDQQKIRQWTSEILDSVTAELALDRTSHITVRNGGFTYALSLNRRSPTELMIAFCRGIDVTVTGAKNLYQLTVGSGLDGETVKKTGEEVDDVLYYLFRHLHRSAETSGCAFQISK